MSSRTSCGSAAHSAHIYIVGGAAMSLAFARERTTRDVDARIDTGHSRLTEAVRKLGRKYGLGDTWLNDQATTAIPPPNRRQRTNRVRVAVPDGDRRIGRAPAGDEAPRRTERGPAVHRHAAPPPRARRPGRGDTDLRRPVPRGTTQGRGAGTPEMGVPPTSDQESARHAPFASDAGMFPVARLGRRTASSAS